MITSLSLPPFNHLIINFFTFSSFFIFLIKKLDHHKNKKLEIIEQNLGLQASFTKSNNNTIIKSISSIVKESIDIKYLVKGAKNKVKIANNNSLSKILNHPYDAPGVLNDGENTSEYTWLFSHFGNPGVMARDYTVS